MAFSEKFGELLENEEFQKGLEGKDYDEYVAAYAAQGVDVEKELEAAEEAAEGELSGAELETVAGGKSSLKSILNKAIKMPGKSIKAVWKYSGELAILTRAYYDLQKYGDATKHYSADRLYKAARTLGLE